MCRPSGARVESNRLCCATSTKGRSDSRPVQAATSLAAYWASRKIGFDEVYTGTLERQVDTAAIVGEALRSAGIRVSLFLDPDIAEIERAKDAGADRIELYTESYARAFDGGRAGAELRRFARAAAKANEVGLGVNAGHDLTLDNVGEFCSAVPGVLEVSIGHALISHAVEVGLRRAVQDYLHALRPRSGASA